MGTTGATQTPSERKRISIPKADESSLDWWEAQSDPGLSIRMLIRAEIERSGYVDTAFRPVAQQPRRGRPPGAASDSDVNSETVDATPATIVTSPPQAPAPAAPAVAVAPEPIATGAGPSAIDLIMNG